jgi:hypothetical protein
MGEAEQSIELHSGGVKACPVSQRGAVAIGRGPSPPHLLTYEPRRQLAGTGELAEPPTGQPPHAALLRADRGGP